MILNKLFDAYAILSSYDQKLHVSFCHHLASVVSLISSSLKPMGQFEPRFGLIIFKVSAFNIIFDDPANHPTRLLLL